jgi:NADPH-dependent 2,4-dienoyl-CoA reductase/sulfur reductase-like enzyme
LAKRIGLTSRLAQNDLGGGEAMERKTRRVVVIGTGPSGLAAARYLQARGFDPVIYDERDWFGDRRDASAGSSRRDLAAAAGAAAQPAE